MPGKAEPSDDEVVRLLAAGEKIAAIKSVRQRKGLGLKEAKDYVDAIESRLNPQNLSAAPSTPSTGCAALVLFLLAILAAAMYYWRR